MMRNHYFKGYSPSNFIVVAFFSLIRLYLFFLRWFVLLLVQHTNAHGLSENPKKDYFQGHESVLKGPPPSLQVAKKLIIHQREIQKNPMTEDHYVDARLYTNKTTSKFKILGPCYARTEPYRARHLFYFLY
ncbi:uncharacterized protein [Nicotiana tomentosiformis]|uniref:uncharacterized protein isoform X5 n=1 Tax=Nicotiana tomentosiformis TaxID=4098 RepID=UPI00051C57E0|nr:uncharacterized protein LOC104112532 isoform X3 [Nicotiana tomentosiformis]XP_033516242.1 uncharacterized protein LOC104112532 isoform X3 [Nicotiana tomentosiformis]